MEFDPRLTGDLEPQEDDEDDVGEDIFWYCMAHRERRPCLRNGQCVRYAFQAHTFDICEDFTITTDPQEVGAKAIDDNN